MKKRACPGPPAAMPPPGCAATVTRRANPPGPGRGHSTTPRGYKVTSPLRPPPGGERGPEPGVRAGPAPPAPSPERRPRPARRPQPPRSAHTAPRGARGRPPGAPSPREAPTPRAELRGDGRPAKVSGASARPPGPLPPRPRGRAGGGWAGRASLTCC